MFVGEKFESTPALKLARLLVLDLFRGEPVSGGEAALLLLYGLGALPSNHG